MPAASEAPFGEPACVANLDQELGHAARRETGQITERGFRGFDQSLKSACHLTLARIELRDGLDVIIEQAKPERRRAVVDAGAVAPVDRGETRTHLLAIAPAFRARPRSTRARALSLSHRCLPSSSFTTGVRDSQ
jgi:hypothetical protein